VVQWRCDITNCRHQSTAAEQLSPNILGNQEVLVIHTVIIIIVWHTNCPLCIGFCFRLGSGLPLWLSACIPGVFGYSFLSRRFRETLLISDCLHRLFFSYGFFWATQFLFCFSLFRCFCDLCYTKLAISSAYQRT